MLWLTFLITAAFGSPPCDIQSALKPLTQEPAPHYSKTDFERDLDHAFPTRSQQWQKNLVRKLWEPYVDKPFQKIDLKKVIHGISSDSQILFYPVKAPIKTAQVMIKAAQEAGFPVAERYLVIPGKYVLSQVASNPFKTVTFIAALSANSKTVTRWIGIEEPQALIEETNPDDLGQKEVTLFVQFGKNETRDDGNTANPIDWKVTDSLRKEYPSKFHQIDLSNLSTPLFINERIQNEADELKKEGKKIKKIIVMSHGAPGVIEWEQDMGTYPTPLKKIAERLAPLKPYLSTETKVTFQGCNVGRGKDGEDAVHAFGNKLLPPGAQVQASRNSVVAGLGPNEWDRNANDIVRGFSILSPQASLIAKLFLDPVKATTDKMEDQKKYRGNLYLKQAYYQYTVPVKK